MKNLKTFGPLLLLLISPCTLLAQDEETETSADISTEEVTDAFQENFFEALKQAGIEDYDRAIAALNRIPGGDRNGAVQRELARNYRKIKRYGQAETHITTAIRLEPENYWYWEELLTTYRFLQRDNWSAIEPLLTNWTDEFRDPLARAFIKKKRYREAESVIAGVSAGSRKNRLEHFLNRRKEIDAPPADNMAPKKAPPATSGAASDPETVEEYRRQLTALKEQGKTTELEALASKAVNSYPLQPEFAVYYGFALNSRGAYGDARTVLEEARAYLIDEKDGTGQSLLRTLLDTYRALGDTPAANRIEKVLNSESP
jgi:tetratricopeptide (TPR) repeat protein